MTKQTDIKESWAKEGEEAGFIMEGDIVALHNWGINNGTQIIGIAEVVWDDEYHKWDFKMIAGDYIDDEYDRWRQCPRVIGNTEDGTVDDEFRSYFDGGGWSITENTPWQKLIDAEKINADISYEKKRIERLKNASNKKIKEKKDEIKEHEAELVKLEAEQVNIIRRIKEESKNEKH